jgi:hypothetical protein
MLDRDVLPPFLRLLLNCACYSVHAPARLRDVAEALGALSLKSLGALEGGEFVKACHVCVHDCPEAAEKLKSRAEVIRQIKRSTDGARELLEDLMTTLGQ